MAIAVNTWAEFLAAYENNSDGTIEIMSDLDANDNLPDTSYMRPISKTINGNGHTIYNISTQAVVNNPIFRSAGNSLVINNTNFYNLNIIHKKFCLYYFLIIYFSFYRV